MKTYFTLNKKRYEAKEFDFNLICDLQEFGVDIEKVRQNPAAAIRAYVALCMDGDKEQAGKEIQDHIIGGGKLDDVSEAMTKKMQESDFFQALNKTTEETTPAEK